MRLTGYDLQEWEIMTDTDIALVTVRLRRSHWRFWSIFKLSKFIEYPTSIVYVELQFIHQFVHIDFSAQWIEMSSHVTVQWRILWRFDGPQNNFTQCNEWYILRLLSILPWLDESYIERLFVLLFICLLSNTNRDSTWKCELLILAIHVNLSRNFVQTQNLQAKSNVFI